MKPTAKVKCKCGHDFSKAIAVLRMMKKLRVPTPKCYKPTFADRMGEARKKKDL